MDLTVRKRERIQPRSISVTEFSAVVHFDKYDVDGAYHWDECDRRYNNWKRYNPALDARYKITLRKIADIGVHGSLLDIGCGDGMLMALAAPLMHRVTGIDSERGAVRLAKEKLRNFQTCEAIHARSDELPFEARSFDAQRFEPEQYR